jgi:hypothetical protein
MPEGDDAEKDCAIEWLDMFKKCTVTQDCFEFRALAAYDCRMFTERIESADYKGHSRDDRVPEMRSDRQSSGKSVQGNQHVALSAV